MPPATASRAVREIVPDRLRHSYPTHPTHWFLGRFYFLTSRGFRSPEGAADFATIRGFLSTARKQGWNIIGALTRDLGDLEKALRAA